MFIGFVHSCYTSNILSNKYTILVSTFWLLLCCLHVFQICGLFSFHSMQFLLNTICLLLNFIIIINWKQYNPLNSGSKCQILKCVVFYECMFTFPCDPLKTNVSFVSTSHHLVLVCLVIWVCLMQENTKKLNKIKPKSPHKHI